MKGMSPSTAKIAAATMSTVLIKLMATRMARIAAMSKFIMTMMFMPRASMTAPLNATESAASCMRS